MKPDLSMLVLKGNGTAQDSFSLTIQAVAKVLGRDVPYPTVYALSTNAWCPGLCTDETCTAWWGMYGRDKAMDVVAPAIGLRARKLDFPKFVNPGRDRPEFSAATLKWRQACVPILRDAMEKGEVLICGGGWEVRPPSGAFNPWCWWGVIVEAREDGTILGHCLNGRSDNTLEGPDSVWGISLAEKPGDIRQAHQAMILRAAERLHGSGTFAAGKVVYGLPTLDLWLRQMESVPYCPDCRDRSWSCADSTARPVREGATVLAAYLRAHESEFPPDSRVREIASHYERIDQLLAPALTGNGGARYQQFMGDLEKQKAHAETLREVKTELGEIATLLHAIAPPVAPLGK